MYLNLFLLCVGLDCFVVLLLAKGMYAVLQYKIWKYGICISSTSTNFLILTPVLQIVQEQHNNTPDISIQALHVVMLNCLQLLDNRK